MKENFEKFWAALWNFLYELFAYFNILDIPEKDAE